MMTDQARRWELTVVDPATLRPDPTNPRTITDAGLDKLRDSIVRFGFASPVLVQRRADDGTEPGIIVAGHQRLKAAAAAGVQEVPVVFLDFTDYEARAYSVADNRLAEESDWDLSLLAGRIEDLEAMAPDLTSVLGFDGEEMTRLLAEAAAGSADRFLDDVIAETEAAAARGEATDGATGREYVALSFAMTPDDRALVLRALHAAMDATAITTSTQALVVIARRYLSE